MTYRLHISFVEESHLLQELLPVMQPEKGQYILNMTDTPVQERVGYWLEKSNWKLYPHNLLIDLMNAFEYFGCETMFNQCGERYVLEMKYGLKQQCCNVKDLSEKTRIYFEKKFCAPLDIFEIENYFGTEFQKNENFFFMKCFLNVNAEHITKIQICYFDGAKNVDISKLDISVVEILSNCESLTVNVNQKKLIPHVKVRPKILINVQISN